MCLSMSSLRAPAPSPASSEPFRKISLLFAHLSCAVRVYRFPRGFPAVCRETATGSGTAEDDATSVVCREYGAACRTWAAARQTSVIRRMCCSRRALGISFLRAAQQKQAKRIWGEGVPAHMTDKNRAATQST